MFETLGLSQTGDGVRDESSPLTQKRKNACRQPTEELRLGEPLSFYVYRLCDPRDGLPFYIGKGKGQRAWQHQADAKSQRISNIPKHNKILAILAAGLEVRIEIAARFADERIAYAYEFDLIRKTPSLTNIVGIDSPRNEPPPSLADILQARRLAKKQHLEKQRKRQYTNFVKGLPHHIRGTAEEWLSGLAPVAEQSSKPVGRPAQPFVPQTSLAQKKKAAKRRGGRCRRKRKPVNPFKADLGVIEGIPPRI